MTAPTQLFRQEAIEFQQNSRQLGQVSSLQPLSTKIVSWFLVAAVGLIVAFLFVGEYARKETVAGYVTPTSGTAKIFASQPGTIKEIHVREGENVQQGHPLLTIETNQISADGYDVNSTILSTLGSQSDLLKKQISAEEQRTKSEQERLSSLIQGLNAEVTQLKAQIKTQTERLQVSEDFVTSVEGLRAKGIMAEAEFKRRKLAALEQKQNLDALNQQLAERRNQLIQNRYSLEQLPTVMGAKIQALHGELATTEQRMAEIDGRRAYVLRAPAAGRVSTMQATVGQFADPRRLQMELVPNDSVMEAQLFVPARAIGFVTTGQPVRIMYDAFPYQQFGTYHGHITNVSQTIVNATDAYGPIALKEPAYRVTAMLERQDIDASGKKIALQADMLFRADIILEKRPLMNWLLDPLLRVRM
ncbi:MAG TPA: HlyD family efflux transporter periplasmic adaptor subunit [Terriglobales bacterium]|nr:HlyD family efflux transporter periplasmic adaptor subunit [Terriglobales bacterium]